MNWLKKFIFLILLIWNSLIYVSLLGGQSYFNQFLPYNLDGVFSRRMGGTGIALATEIPDIFSNPAGLAHLKRPVIFLSLQHVLSKYTHQEYCREDFLTTTTSHKTAPGYAAISFPFKFVKRSWVLGASYSGKHILTFKGLPFDPPFSNQSTVFAEEIRQSIALGLASQLISKFTLGIGWTNWFGNGDWHSNYSLFPVGNSSTKISGNAWHIGVQGKFNRLSIGSVIHFPFSLKSNSHAMENELLTANYIQKLNGAVDIGAAFHLKSGWLFGFGYGYQKSFVMQSQQWGFKYRERCKGTSKFSGGAEYTLIFKKYQLPIFLGYQLQLLPGAFVTNPPDYHIIYGLADDVEKDLLQHEWQLGISLLLKNFRIYAITKWTRSYFYVDMVNSPLISVLHTYRFTVQRVFMIMNFGVSYQF